MRKLLIVIVVAILAIGGVIVFAERIESPGKPSQPTTTQKPEPTTKEEDTIVMQPDINNQKFTLTGATVNCSTSTINGATARNCSGNIRIIPTDQPGRSPGLYKINEQTKLTHSGAEEDLNKLQELSQNQTVVTLKLVDGSEDTLQSIDY